MLIREYLDKVIREYLEKFGELPPLLMTTTYYSPKYIKLMKRALRRCYPVLKEELEREFSDGDYDLVEINVDDESYELMLKYREKFNEEPPYNRVIDYSNPIYKELMKLAIKYDKKIRKSDLRRFYEVDKPIKLDWKKIYQRVIKYVCLSENIHLPLCNDTYPLEDLLRKGVLIINKAATKKSAYPYKLDESIARNYHYKVFCRYVLSMVSPIPKEVFTEND
jgi:hypothetical protein